MYKAIVAATAASALLASGASAQVRSIGSNPQGSLTYATASGIAKVASEDAGLQTRVVPQGGPVITFPLVNDGELDFAVGWSVVAAFAIKGQRSFKGRPQSNLRVAAALFPLRLGFYVRKDSGISKMSQIKGKRTGSGFKKIPIVGISMAGMLATAGIKLEDMVGVPVPNGVRMVDDFIAGRIDTVGWAICNPACRKAHAAVGGIRVLSLPKSPESLAAMQAITPGAYIDTIQPSPRFPGVVGPTNVLAGPLLLMSSTKTPDAVVSRVVKAIHGNKKKLVGVHKAFNGLNPKKMQIDVGLPYHPAAAKFYGEMGK